MDLLSSAPSFLSGSGGAGLPSYQGGDAAPSRADSGVNALSSWSSPFTVGGGGGTKGTVERIAPWAIIGGLVALWLIVKR